MFCSCHHDKVGQPIVALDAIPMMDKLCFKKFPADVLLHFKAMLKNVFFVGSSNKNISRRNFCSTVVPSRMIFSEFSDSNIRTTSRAVFHRFRRQYTSRTASSAILFIVNLPTFINLLSSVVLSHAMRVPSWFMPNIASSVPPSFWNFGKKHIEHYRTCASLSKYIYA